MRSRAPEQATEGRLDRWFGHRTPEPAIEGADPATEGRLDRWFGHRTPEPAADAPEPATEGRLDRWFGHRTPEPAADAPEPAAEAPERSPGARTGRGGPRISPAGPPVGAA